MILKNDKTIGLSTYYDCAPNEKKKLNGVLDETVRWIVQKQLSDPKLWAKFVNQFRLQLDTSNNGWRGEYWGKMMRGASLIAQYTEDNELYSILENSVRDMLTVREESGRISSYRAEGEFMWWDIWSRKYVILAMQYFLDICRDGELKKEIIASMCAQMDYIIERVGDGEGQISITETADVVASLNSCSILEPTVRLYRLTSEKRYLDFAKYIIDCGGASTDNIFKNAYEDRIPPHEYNVVKAYEMMSCFEGLVEYYYVTGDEWCRESALRFGKRLIANETTVVGGCACWGEYFDHASIRQTRKNPPGETMQETCVTVTWMKLCQKLFLLSGDSAFLDCIETSFYNAYLGALNTKDQYCNRIYSDPVKSTLPFDSYSPLTPDTRGRGVGGPQILEDGRYYGCCAAIGAAGAGLYPCAMLSKTENGVLLGLYESGTVKAELPSGKEVKLILDTSYPYGDGVIEITVDTDEDEPFEIALRVPMWSDYTSLSLNGEKTNVSKGINSISRVWKNGDKLVLTLDMMIRSEKAPVFDSSVVHVMDWDTIILSEKLDYQDPEDRLYICLKRGPIVLGVSEEFSDDIYQAVDPVLSDGYAEAEPIELEGMKLAVRVKSVDGKEYILADYGSLGHDWSNKISAWIPISENF